MAIKIRCLMFVFPVLLLTVIIAGCGGTEVREVSVSNRPIPQAQAELTGMSAAQLKYFQDKYPPAEWKLAGSGSRVGVGPVLLSRDALVYLDTQAGQETRASASSGTSRATVMVKSGNGGPVLFLARQYSEEAQAVLVEAFTTDRNFKVMVVEDKAGADLYQGQKRYGDLLSKGIRYYLQSNVSVSKGAVKAVRMYLRFIDAVTKEVVCAVTASGKDMDGASREAARALLKRIRPKPKT